MTENVISSIEDLEREGGGTKKKTNGIKLVRKSVYGSKSKIPETSAKDYYKDLVRQSPEEKQIKLASLERQDFDKVGYEPTKIKQIHKNYNKLRENLGVSQNPPTPLEAENKKIAEKGDKSKLSSVLEKRLKLDKQERKLTKEGVRNKKNNDLILERIKLEDEMEAYGSRDPTKALLKKKLDDLDEQIKINGNQGELEKQKNKVKGEKIEVEKQKSDVEYHVEQHKHKSKDLSEI